MFPKRVNIRRIPPRQWDNPFDACSPGRKEASQRTREQQCEVGWFNGVHTGSARACVSGTETFESRPGFISECPGSYEISFP